MARSPRLTQEQRRHLAVRLASRAIAAEQAALDAAETALFDRLVTQLFTPAELRLLARIPPAWLDGTTGIRVRVRDDHEMRAVATVYHHGSPPRIIPHISVDDVTDRTDPALRQDVRKHDERRRAMFQRRETVKQTLYEHLARCSTHTQDLALLPEAADLLAAWTKTTRAVRAEALGPALAHCLELAGLAQALAQLPDAIADHTPTRGRPEGLPPAEEA